jgi:hypothetical protein
MNLEFYSSHGEALAKNAQTQFNAGVTGVRKLKFVTLLQNDGTEKTFVFGADQHAGVVHDQIVKLMGPMSEDKIKEQVRKRFVAAGVIQKGVVSVESESVARYFDISEEELEVSNRADGVRAALQALMPSVEFEA